MYDFEQLDYYALLGVEPRAPADAIKRAYRQQIQRYHPDRFLQAPEDEQAYARERAQRINEAYATLSDALARARYDRARSPGTLRAPSPVAPTMPPATPSPPRDHQAELYQQATEQIAAGRYAQAVTTLRQLQQINPFYRDSAALLADAENRVRPVTPPPRPAPPPAAPPPIPPATASDRDGRRRLIVAGGVGIAAVAGLIAAALGLRGQQGATPPATPESVAAVPSPAVPTGVPPTVAPTQTSAPPPTTAPPTDVPTLPPTPPAATATLESTATPPNAETGVLRFADDFSRTGRWSTVQQELWNVGYSPTGSGYLIQAEPQVGNIWSYITTPGDPDYSVGVTITTPQPGLAGVLVRFQDRGNYVVCLINPGTQRYRIEQRSGGRLQVVAAGVSPVALDAAEGTRLVVRLRGNGLTLLLNGVLVEDQTLVGLPATTQLGLVAAGDSSTVEARFRDLEVRELP